ncbi:MAG: alpha/beta fold hydrolase [Anaerolineales bacterium]|nr:alpha/beta fold hydrolase [Anaerolineales bacterium]
MPEIIPTAEPFFFPAGKTGCLLIHGFTGAPKEMRWIGEYLAKQGYSVLGVRLTGHATHPEDMIRSRYTDWIASVEDGYQFLSGAVERVFLVGLSMGGVLSLLMSTRLAVRGVVSMSAPYEMPSRGKYPLWVFRFLSRLVKFRPKTNNESGSGWFDKQAYREHISYPQNPVRSAVELKLLLAEMRKVLPLVDVPTLLIHSRDDEYVLPENMPHIYEHLGTAEKQMKWVEGSGHVITRDAAREEVFREVSAFIKRVDK